MRHPSPRCFPNTVTIYRFTGVRDSNGFVIGDATAYTTVLAAGVACSVQPSDTEVLFDEQARPTATVKNYTVLFPANYAVGQSDKIVWVDDLGTTRNIFATGPLTNQAGRNSMWEAHGLEKV